MSHSTSLPTALFELLSPRDKALNNLPQPKLLEMYLNNEIKAHVDTTIALKIASAGFSTSGVTQAFSYLFPVALLATFPLLYFFGWEGALLSVVISAVAFRASKYFLRQDILSAATSDSKSLLALMMAGAIWFQY